MVRRAAPQRKATMNCEPDDGNWLGGVMLMPYMHWAIGRLVDLYMPVDKETNKERKRTRVSAQEKGKKGQKEGKKGGTQ
jgi:hypothetical protein